LNKFPRKEQTESRTRGSSALQAGLRRQRQQGDHRRGEKLRTLVTGLAQGGLRSIPVHHQLRSQGSTRLNPTRKAGSFAQEKTHEEAKGNGEGTAELGISSDSAERYSGCKKARRHKLKCNGGRSSGWEKCKYV